MPAIIFECADCGEEHFEGLIPEHSRRLPKPLCSFCYSAAISGKYAPENKSKKEIEMLSRIFGEIEEGAPKRKGTPKENIPILENKMEKKRAELYEMALGGPPNSYIDENGKEIFVKDSDREKISNEMLEKYKRKFQ